MDGIGSKSTQRAALTVPTRVSPIANLRRTLNGGLVRERGIKQKGVSPVSRGQHRGRFFPRCARRKWLTPFCVGMSAAGHLGRNIKRNRHPHVHPSRETYPSAPDARRQCAL